MKNRFFILGLMLLLPLLHILAQETATDSITRSEEQPEIFRVDTVGIASLVANEAEKPTKTKPKSNFKPSPTKALLWAIVPGGGQIYNRKYWKIPIVYAGAAALTYDFWYYGSRYNKYHKAYISVADTDPETNYYKEVIPKNMSDDQARTSLNTAQLSYRRYRDLVIIGSVAFYGLTFLDAYVDAQLHDFDISPDLSFRVKPTFSTDTNAALGVSCQLKF